MTWDTALIPVAMISIIWIFAAVMLVRLGRLIYIERRYGGPDEYLIARFNRAFERFK